MLMRGGTSKGPVFLASDLPAETQARDQLLLSLMGSPDVRQIDGIGGGDSLTSQVLIVSPGSRSEADVDYLFAQVAVGRGEVDTTPNCGNMVSAVAAFALERGLIAAADTVTRVRMLNVNTGKRVVAHVPTRGWRVTYDGNTHIDGVPGSAAGIVLDFLDPAGACSGRLLPTGRPVDMIDGVAVSCVDYGILVVMLEATSVGKTGHESKRELDADHALTARLEQLRRKAGALMGLPFPEHGVLPKVALLATPRAGGNISSRFYVPWNCHVAHSASGGICIAAATRIPGTVAAQLCGPYSTGAKTIVIEHPSGTLPVRLDGEPSDLTSGGSHASVILTARPLFDGLAFPHALPSPQLAAA
jgi:2-methylaconitate cis-trans-isomerase PrpF